MMIDDINALDVKRCIKCEGRKQITGLGNIYHDCDKCNGVGYVYELDENKPKPKLVVTKKVKKKGRPKATLNLVDMNKDDIQDKFSSIDVQDNVN